MKCRVCGYETTDNRSYCPMCGTKVAAENVQREAAPIDMTWNTKDFPKPKQMEDIEMNWGGQPVFMKKDASEGYVTVNTDEEKLRRREKPVDFEIPAFMNQQTQQAPVIQQAPQYDRKPDAPQVAKAPDYNILPKREDSFAAWTMPQRQEEPEYKYYNVQQPVFQPSPTPTFTSNSTYSQNPTYVRQTYTPSPTPALTPAERDFWYGQVYAQQPAVQPQPVVQPQQVQYQVPVQTQPQIQYQVPVQPQPVAQPQQVQYQAPVQTQPQIQYQAPVQTQPQIQYQVPMQPQPVVQQPMVQQPAVQPQQVQYQAPVQTQVFQPKPQPEKFNYEKAYPNYDAVNSQAQKSPEEFYTFQAKNEEFQKLLDEEYQRINSLRGSDYTLVPSDTLAAALKKDSDVVKAQDVSAFEKSLLGEDTKKTAAPEEVLPEEPEEKEEEVFFNETDETDISLDELISDPLDPRFNIDTIEKTINELKQQDVKDDKKRSERRERLAAMEAAREAYFRSLDEEAGITSASSINPESYKDDDIFSPENKEEEAEKKETEIAEPETKLMDAQPIEGVNEEHEEIKAEEPEEDIEEVQLEEKPVSSQEEQTEERQEEPSEEKKELHPQLKGLYKDSDNSDEYDEDEENEVGGFFKFLGIVIIVIAILELAILALKNFLPDAAITETATQIELAVLDAIKSLFNGIASLFNKTAK